MNLLKQLEAEQMSALRGKKALPKFRPGDTVKVNVKVVDELHESFRADAWTLYYEATRRADLVFSPKGWDNVARGNAPGTVREKDHRP